jgi:UDPglucose 6-dehydrogenase
MKITFIGHGYVGLVTAAVFADLGNTVWVIGHTPEKVENLKKGIIPIYEPGLEEIVKRNVESGRLLFTLDYDKAIPESEIVFSAVGTPPREDGSADLSVVFDVAKKTAKYLKNYTVIATKSTVPIGTNQKIKKIIEENKPKTAEFDIASCPEFLREGQAISDTLHPDRVVIGTESKKAEDLLVKLHSDLDSGEIESKGRFVLTNIETAEMIKYAANAFLATKISFANAIAKLSELTGADATKVLRGIGMDRRIGPSFLAPGAGYGGSCFPKDVKALIAISKDLNYDFALLKEVEEINKQASEDIVKKAVKFLGEVRGKKIALLGLSFKPDTDDMREAPSISIIAKLVEKGAKISAYDPIAMKNAKNIIKSITFSNDAYSCVKDADLVIIITEWEEFKGIDLKKMKGYMKGKYLIDGRNIYDSLEAKNAGFTYIGVGR